MAEQQLPVWNNRGIEPPANLQQDGWQPGVKPPAQYFDWLFNRAYKCLEELQAITETLETNKADAQGLKTLSTTVSSIMDGTAIKKSTINAGEQLVDSTIKSPVNVLRIDGKTIVNLAPLFDSGAWLQASSDTATSTVDILTPNSIRITNNDATKRARYSTPFSVKANTDYTVRVVLTGNARIIVATDDGATLITETTNSQFTFNSGQYTLLRIYMAVNFVAGSATFSDLTVSEGTAAKPFVANVKGLTNPTIVNETNGTSLVIPTTLYAGEYVEQNAKGELVKYRKRNEIVLDDKQTYVHVSGKTGFKQVGINNLVTDKTTATYDSSLIAVKYNGSILKTATITELNAESNVIYLYGKDLRLSIANVDSGWGDSYTPTADEMKAYFLGWKMYDSSGGTDLNSGAPLYNGTGTKSWQRYAEGNTKFLGATTIVPTTMTVISPVWQPHRFSYELTAHVQEVIQPYSDLTLEKGDNTVKVYAGRIVNEYNKPYRYVASGYDRYEINTLSQSPTKYNIKKLHKVYENSKLSGGWVFELTAAGYERGIRNTPLHDPATAYTVDYDPLYEWQVTAPIDSVQLQYFETLQAATNELVHDVAKQQDTMRRMLEDVVNEGEGLRGFNLTTINMTDGYVVVTKDRSGYVNVNIYFRSGVWSPGTVIARLPVGYRPGFLRAAVGGITGTSPYTLTGTFQISSGGDISMAYDTKLVAGQSYTNANVSGNALYREGN